jgi:hypothetical protein
VAVSLTANGEHSLVTHYYRAILRRAPDAPGKSFWEGEATRMSAAGGNINETWYSMASFFFFSPEYASFNRDNNGFVTDLYNTFFNRAPDSASPSGPGSSRRACRARSCWCHVLDRVQHLHPGHLRQHRRARRGETRCSTSTAGCSRACRTPAASPSG